jgi:hypothetical protein
MTAGIKAFQRRQALRLPVEQMKFEFVINP